MDDRKEKTAPWLTVPQFGDWDQKGPLPDYSLDFSKLRENRKQNKRDLSRASLGNEEELVASAAPPTTTDSFPTENNHPYHQSHHHPPPFLFDHLANAQVMGPLKSIGKLCSFLDDSYTFLVALADKKGHSKLLQLLLESLN